MSTADGELTSQPTGIRHQIVGLATLMSLLLYLDRYCISICTNYIRQDLAVTAAVVSLLSSAFFFAYALFQVPSGWLIDKYGVRKMLSLFILAWSACIGLQAFVQSFAVLALLQFCCGMAQAGAYPAGARLVREWTPPMSRGSSSAMVALGGRVGGALAPILTAWMLIQFVPVSTNSTITDKTFLDPVALARQLRPKAETTEKPKLVDQQREYLWNQLLPAEQSLIVDLGHLADENAAALKVDPKTAVLRTASPEQTEQLRGLLNRLIDSPTMYQPQLFDEVIENEGRRLSTTLQAQGELPLDQLQRLNRLALERTFSKELGNVYVAGWRPSMLVYGVLGIVMAALFWLQVRDSPNVDSRPNLAERELINAGAAPVTAVQPIEPFPWMALLTNISLWGNCLMQVTTNIGWLFLVRNMPQYLEEVHGVSLVMRGWMTSVPIWAGVIGVFFGGRLTDWMGQRLGLKWGRRMPVLITRYTSALGYALCILFSYLVPKEVAPPWMPWVYVAALSLVAISTDIGVPAVWAFAQDVGGKYTASILGWANMWGNLGATAATPLYELILGKSPELAQWNTLFAVLGGVFLLSSVGAMLMDASKPLSAARPQAVT